jgi:hypothetical protein
MNAPISVVLPVSLVGETIYYPDTEEGEYDEDKDEYGPEVKFYHTGLVLGISVDSDGEVILLVEVEGTARKLGHWHAGSCALALPKGEAR